MEPSTWLTFMETEYLDGFVKSGGAGIKFAVPLDSSDAEVLQNEIDTRAAERGFIVTRVDAAQTRVHMVDQVFFAIANQIPWRESVAKFMQSAAEEAGFAWPDAGPEPLFQRLAQTNHLEPTFVQTELRPMIQNRIFRNKRLDREFRIAMTRLAFSELTGEQESERVILEWLGGQNRSVSAVKPYQIFSRVSRANARYLLESLLVWLGSVGYAGLVLLLDITRVSVARNPKDGAYYYTKAGVLDTYELLRQFLDGMDRLEKFFMVVLPAEEFLDEQSTGRGMGIYDALKFRVFDEVRDRTLVNPMASLVRLERQVGANPA